MLWPEPCYHLRSAGCHLSVPASFCGNCSREVLLKICSWWHSYSVPINGFLVPFIWEILGKEYIQLILAELVRIGADPEVASHWSLGPWGKIWFFEPPGWQIQSTHSPSAPHSHFLLQRNPGHSTVLCCDGWTSTKRPPLGDLVLHLLEAGATFKLVQWNCVNKPQKVLWVQKGSSLALFIHWHLIYSSFSYSVVLEDKFTLPNGKKKPKPKSASQTRNKLNEIRLMWGNTKSYPGKKMKSCAVDCKSSHACWEWTLTATSCVGLFLFVIFEQSGAAQPIVWAEE